ncbi:hypothetical protein L596_019190 [Steinernema carpocapsae]|uniref:Uncharacterized protein n=1 Tax=Steinernema carpocapsae TaxID=34508 RepID=A0A4U5MPP3_STECR|nr:hypothetical protein L596_019190 [Steinernema carpocapsae]
MKRGKWYCIIHGHLNVGKVEFAQRAQYCGMSKIVHHCRILLWMVLWRSIEQFRCRFGRNVDFVEVSQL